ncbi:HU family DNA-binding protein [Candidatus Acetothermia bacterium]|nr:HU family DNA-binding protein [Candidatus Acetothermia bacterium]MBI3643952.1 HU family DNA-binding protein [Candidatus Acetothermia bacterium]
MTKQEFIEGLAKKTKLSKKDARTVVDEALELIVGTVKRNQKITLTGFGTFEARKQKATQRINPQTGKKMNVPAKSVPKFRPGKAFKEALRK